MVSIGSMPIGPGTPGRVHVQRLHMRPIMLSMHSVSIESMLMLCAEGAA